jgi:glycosyltransferase involved in cell wall biosynthesis
MKVLIIIPAYNEEQNLDWVVKDIRANCPDYDYVIVNDCSTDGTVRLCRDRGYSYLDLYANLGFSGAVQTGYKYAQAHGYDIAVQFDGDGQHPASIVPAMVRLIESGQADYVLGSRFAEAKKPWSLRMLGSRLLSCVIWIRTGAHIGDPTSGLRAINCCYIEKMARNLNFVAEPDTLTRAILNKARVVEVQASMRDRQAGVSHFSSPINSIKYMVRIMLSILFFQGRSW